MQLWVLLPFALPRVLGSATIGTPPWQLSQTDAHYLEVHGQFEVGLEVP